MLCSAYDPHGPIAGAAILISNLLRRSFSQVTVMDSVKMRQFPRTTLKHPPYATGSNLRPTSGGTYGVNTNESQPSHGSNDIENVSISTYILFVLCVLSTLASYPSDFINGIVNESCRSFRSSSVYINVC